VTKVFEMNLRTVVAITMTAIIAALLRLPGTGVMDVSGEILDNGNGTIRLTPGEDCSPKFIASKPPGTKVRCVQFSECDPKTLKCVCSPNFVLFGGDRCECEGDTCKTKWLKAHPEYKDK